MEQDPPIEHQFIQTAVLVDIEVKDTVVKPTVGNDDFHVRIVMHVHEEDLETSKLGRFVLGESLDEYIAAIRTPVSETYFPAFRKFALKIAELESFQQFPELPHEIQEKPNAALKAFEDKILSYSR